MYTIPFFRKILNLNWKKVKIDWIYVKTKRLIFKIKWKYNNTICPHCGFNTNKRQDRKLHKQLKLLPHMPYGWDKMIFLELHKRYFKCNNCNTQFYEQFDFESEHWIYTKHFEQYIQWNWWFVSWNKLAKLYQTSVSVVYSILERIDINLINEKWIEIIKNLNEVWLWVDEHSFSWRNMILIITELKTKKVLAVIDWITKEKLDNWIWNILPLNQHKKIKWYNTDMNKGYTKSLEKICWNPIWWVDKYHLWQEANRVVDQVRDISINSLSMNFVKLEDIHKLGKRAWNKITKEDIKKLNDNQTNKKKIKAMKKYKEKAEQRLNIENIDPKDLLNSKWIIGEYKEITAEYFIEKWYRLLFMYREKNLSWQQKLRLNQIFREFDYLGFLQESRTLKEDFYDALDDLNLDEIDRIRDDALNSEHRRIKQFWRTIKRWYKWIKWYIENSTKNFKFTNALTEWINNLCKVVKRVSHWFRTKEMYIKKLTARFCLKELQI